MKPAVTRAPRPGDRLALLDDSSVTLGQRFGQGGQGGVYEVEGSPDRCVKIYYVDEARASGLRRRFTKLAAKAAHLDTSVLVLPTATLAAPWAGYVMHRVRDAKPLSAWAVPTRGDRVDHYYATTGGLRRRLLLAHALVKAFRALHLKGLAYSDLSWENVLVPIKGRPAVHLIDCDNLSIDGVAPTGIEGTPWFIAPEVVARTHPPDTVSDTHSLAVLLFHMLVLTHPLLGDRVRQGTPDDEQAALAGRWPFDGASRLPWIDHPEDHRNASRAGLPRSMVLSPSMGALFHQTFGAGLLGPSRMKRPTEKKWQTAIAQAVDATVTCPRCTHTYFINAKTCPWCPAPRPEHWVLLCHQRGKRRPVVIQKGRRLHSRHMHGRPDIDSTTVLAKLDVTGDALRVTANEQLRINPSPDRTSGTLLEQNERADLKPGDRIQLAAEARAPLIIEVQRG